MYQCQPIDIQVPLGVLDDVPVWHPRTYDTKWEQCLRNLNNGEYVRMGSGPALVDFMKEGLM
jgi:hypothetical protein